MTWKHEKFSSICDFVRGPFGGSLKKNIFKLKGYAVYEQQHAIYDQFTDIRYFIDEDKFSEMSRFELLPGDLIMSCSGTMGRVAIVPKGIQKGIINQALLKLSPNKKIIPKFLKLWMESDNFQKQIHSLSQGVAIKNMASVKILKQIMTPIPPLQEQTRIVAILDQAFADIEKIRANTEKNLKNACELFESYLQQVFSQRSDEWCARKVEEVTKTSAGGTPLKARKEYYENGDIPWILSGEVGFKDIKKSKNFITQSGLKNSSAKIFPRNTVLVAMYGATAGEVGILKFEACTNQAVCGILPCDMLLPEYIYYFFLSYKKQLISQAVGNAQPNISQDKIKKTKIPILPIEEQRQIVDILEKFFAQIGTLSKLYKSKISELDNLKKSLLHQAFTGQLTKQEVAV